MNNELPFIREMFEKISPKYDMLNRMLSLRQDVLWRRTMISAMQLPDTRTNTVIVLDAACGTGDVGVEILKHKKGNVKVIGADFSTGMLMMAKRKIDGLLNGSNISLCGADAFKLPFKDETFDAVTIAFGIRNISDKNTVLKIFHKSLKHGGMLLVLELTKPEQGFLLSFYLHYFKKILPAIGRFFSKHENAYRYLPLSVENFPDASTFASMIKSAGFVNIKWKKMTFGIATLFVGYKI